MATNKLNGGLENVQKINSGLCGLHREQTCWSLCLQWQRLQLYVRQSCAKETHQWRSRERPDAGCREKRGH